MLQVAIVAVVVVAFVLLAVLLALQAGDPHAEQDGRTVQEWAQVLESGDLLERQKAMTALRKLGPTAKPALPELWALARSRDRETKGRALRAISEIATDGATLEKVREWEERLVS